MRDQADKLRDLALRAAREKTPFTGNAPRIIALTGGKGGVGTSTLSLNFSVALARQGRRVVLVDADSRHADVSLLCGLEEKYSIVDVMTAKRDIHEVLQPGPGGIQILPGIWSPGSAPVGSPLAYQRLFSQLQSLGRHTDFVLLDVGNDASDAAQNYWASADQAVIITTSNFASIMDSYTTIKLALAHHPLQSISVIVNQAEDEEAAVDVYDRINTSCQRFLGTTVSFAGYVPLEKQVNFSTDSRIPFVLKYPKSDVTRAIDRVATILGSSTVVDKAA